VRTERSSGRSSEPRKNRTAIATSAAGEVSLARALSKLGLCSRKEAERLIRAGRVEVDGRRLLSPQARIAMETASIRVDGQAVRHSATRVVILLHKPVGYITARTDPGGRPTVYALIDRVGSWVFPVGRLDRDSAGLLILTNDHRLGHALTDPAHHVPKTYQVRVTGVPSEEALAELRRGIPWRDGTTTRGARVRALGVNRDGSSWLEVVLTEGRNRQVRRMCSAVGHDVLDLVRTRVGRLGLGDLPQGEWRRLGPQDVRKLLDSAARAGDPRGGRQ
jgi:23S rRNA pseudouridine2605 synthase